MIRRGIHRQSQSPEPSTSPASAEVAVTATADQPTPPSWWIKTIASWVLLALAFGTLGALVVVPRLTGSTTYTVLTGSMEPKYPPGTLIVVRPTAGEDLNAGDVVTFQPESGNPAVVTHRIVSVFYDGQGQRRFITKGDANKVQDDTQLVADQIRGRLWYSVPYLGRINSLLSGSVRTVAVFVIGGGLLLYAIWVWIAGSGKKSGPSDDPGPGSTSGDPADPDPAGSGPMDPHTGQAPGTTMFAAAQAPIGPPLAWSAVTPPEAGAPATDVAPPVSPELACRSCGSSWDPVPVPPLPVPTEVIPSADPPAALFPAASPVAAPITRPMPVHHRRPDQQSPDQHSVPPTSIPSNNPTSNT